jgi:hypothetical protein
MNRRLGRNAPTPAAGSFRHCGGWELQPRGRPVKDVPPLGPKIIRSFGSALVARGYDILGIVTTILAS